MRRFACIALALMALVGLAACTNEGNGYTDNPMHNGYPGPAPRDRNM
jgi:hypothetical protein